MLRRSSFWFLRHGETDWNKQNLAQGQVEIPLNETGREQARLAAARLQGHGIASIVTSPIGRAKATAEAAAATTGAPISVDPELKEVNFGDHEGQPIFSQWFEDWVGERSTPPGGESFADLRVRAVRAVNRALQQPHPVLVVAHGGLFRALRSAMGLEPNIRTANGVPLLCEPGDGDAPWTLTPILDPG